MSRTHDTEGVWSTIASLSCNERLVSKDILSIQDLKEGSNLLSSCISDHIPVGEIVQRPVKDMKVLRFLDFTLSICEKLRARLGDGTSTVTLTRTSVDWRKSRMPAENPNLQGVWSSRSHCEHCAVISRI